MADIKIRVEGLDQALRAAARFGERAEAYFQRAGEEAADEILDTPGLRAYPPLTAANLPPAPYYIRGRGTQYASGRNRGESQRLGTRFYVRADPGRTVIGNTASYAEHVVGFEQAFAMFVIGWRRLYDVAHARTADITRVYQGWLDKLIRDAGLE